MGVGFRIKQILRDRKMTIKQLSEKSGISVNTLYSITKRDSENVDPVIMQKIADTLDIPIYELEGYKLVHDTPENRAIAEAGFKAAFGRSSKNEHETENDSVTTKDEAPEDSGYVAAVFGIPDAVRHILLDDFFEMGVKPEQIVKESPRAAIVGEGFIVDFLTPDEAKRLADHAVKKLTSLIDQTKKVLDSTSK